MHPSLVRVYASGDNNDDSFLYLDESYSIPDSYEDGAFYILSAAQVQRGDLEGTRSRLREIVGGDWWHTTDELRSSRGRETTQKLLEQISTWADPYFITVATPLNEGSDPEDARRDCLRELISHVYSSDSPTHPHGIVFEARHHQKENNRDRRLVKLLRAEEVLFKDTPAAWVSPGDECLLWLADLACMAYRRQLTHRDDTSRYFSDYLATQSHIIKVRPRTAPKAPEQ